MLPDCSAEGLDHLTVCGHCIQNHFCVLANIQYYKPYHFTPSDGGKQGVLSVKCAPLLTLSTFSLF